MCNHGKTESPWITAINVVLLPKVYKESSCERKRRRRRSFEVQREACKRISLFLPLPLFPFENKFIFQGETLYGVFVYEKRRGLGDKSEIRGFAIEGGAREGTRIQSQRQRITVIRHSTSSFVSYHHNRLSLTIIYLICIRFPPSLPLSLEISFSFSVSISIYLSLFLFLVSRDKSCPGRKAI